MKIFSVTASGEVLKVLKEAKWTLEIVKDPKSYILRTSGEIPYKTCGRKS